MLGGPREPNFVSFHFRSAVGPRFEHITSPWIKVGVIIGSVNTSYETG